MSDFKRKDDLHPIDAELVDFGVLGSVLAGFIKLLIGIVGFVVIMADGMVSAVMSSFGVPAPSNGLASDVMKAIEYDIAPLILKIIKLLFFSFRFNIAYISLLLGLRKSERKPDSGKAICFMCKGSGCWSCGNQGQLPAWGIPFLGFTLFPLFLFFDIALIVWLCKSLMQ